MLRARVRPCLSILALLIFLLQSLAVDAATTYRSPIGGYRFGSSIYPDATLLATKGCVGAWFVHHLTFTPNANAAGPDVTIYCGMSQPDGTVATMRWAGFSWVLDCAQGMMGAVNGQTQCIIPGVVKEKPCQECPSPKKGNPINMAKKEKVQTELDYASSLELQFTRLYSSYWTLHATEGVSPGWRHNYSMRVTSNLSSSAPYYVREYKQQASGEYAYLPIDPPTAVTPFARVTRADGYSQFFRSNDGGASWTADADVNMKLSATRNELGNVTAWRLTTAANDVEYYGDTGQLTDIKYANGLSLSFIYSDSSTPVTIASAPNLLIKVIDNFGRSLMLGYDDKNRIISMTTPSEKVFLYAYDAFGNLASVTYPDGLKKLYHYNEPAYQLKTGTGNDRLLTGLSFDTSPGVISRYAIFRYDTNGWPVSTEHAGGADKVTISYSPRSYTNALGATTSPGYTTLNGMELQTSENRPNGSGGIVYSFISYDTNGNFASRTDYNGNVTTYSYDLVRNLELSRVEGSGTAVARTIKTEWHPTLRLPARIAEPRRITTFSYDTNGLLLGKVVQATSDANGTQGFTATAVGSPRVWQYTYNSYGQVLTAKGPRTDVNDLTTYSYDASGNLASVTNALGHQTTFTGYDADGRVGTITDPNGNVTTLTYTLRGQIATHSVGNETTSYTYDGANCLTQAVLPNGATITYSYDAALRLTGIADNLGNSITYTLDAMGNRLSEQVKDSAGTLARQTTRVFDTLGQLKQQTGGVQ
ncbi:hypothetical protein GCM10027277_49800 [Pseudoduganella ginsengisoli]|uniref:DUF6531 domain-containing protein n=1 Tax=Pseudoduganella ginsengisoli TaxID=1462440 RepID=A0A6L6Q4H3_9BURK|nr:DUF6531 domain-containing protein [Pseudoduganella ginsengisoli]MTW04600.1 hypothetical protein [Pseudoduganella ginsengisoli]